MEHTHSQRTITKASLSSDTFSNMMPVTVGSAAPDFTATAVVDGRLKEISLAGYADASHWVCLVFFPRAWSYICPTEIRAFSARLEEFLYNRTCAVVFVSTDSEHCLRAWNHTSEMEGGLGGVHVPLVSDCNHRLSKQYGVLVEDEGVAQRALFIIDPKGTVRNVSINDADVGRSVDETLRLIDALQFKDQFGEGCPADWKKGESGIQMGTANRTEGPLELKKTWTDWARPKFARAWSATSGKSLSLGSNSGSINVPATPSPLMSPTSHAVNPMEKNFEAAMTNAMANHAIGVAN